MDAQTKMLLELTAAQTCLRLRARYPDITKGMVLRIIAEWMTIKAEQTEEAMVALHLS